jgi:hypothetical protein
MTEPKSREIPPMQELYLNDPECLIVLFNLRYSGAGERLQREKDARHSFAHVEKPTGGCSALIIRLGVATGLAS